MPRFARKIIPVLAYVLIMGARYAPAAGRPVLDIPSSVFNVRDYGATGNREGSSQAAIQKAIDACAAAGGGMVYVPPGSYSTGTLHLRSHVRVFVEAGAVIYSIKDKAAFDKDALPSTASGTTGFGGATANPSTSTSGSGAKSTGAQRRRMTFLQEASGTSSSGTSSPTARGRASAADIPIIGSTG